MSVEGKKAMKIVVLPGDGIGPETMAVTVAVLNATSARFGLNLELQHDIAGHESLQKYGATVTPELLAKVQVADGLMLGHRQLELSQAIQGLR